MIERAAAVAGAARAEDLRTERPPSPSARPHDVRTYVPRATVQLTTPIEQVLGHAAAANKDSETKIPKTPSQCSCHVYVRTHHEAPAGVAFGHAAKVRTPESVGTPDAGHAAALLVVAALYVRTYCVLHSTNSS